MWFPHPVDINPALLTLGPLEIRWYGLMYVWSFILAGQLMKRLIKENYFKVTPDKVDLFLTYMLVGMFFGARTFYVFVYNWDYYSQHMSEILSVWRGGLSFHGALVGMIISLSFFARKVRRPFLEVADVLALAGSQGLFWGRMGNFLNGELYGRISDVPWAMIFKEGGPYARHPSQLYEAFFEGIVLWSTLWFLRKKIRFQGGVSALFLVLYASFRFFVEFFREPDVQLGYFFSFQVTMGQILCLLMGLGGLGYFFFCKKKNLPVQGQA